MIQLAILCPSKFVKQYSLDEVLAPLLGDLKILEQDGITFMRHGEEHTLKGTVSFLSADNLGAHEIGGFQVHFHSGRVCRKCNIVKTDLKKHFRADLLQNRTREAYDQQVEAVQENPNLSSVYGIKKASSLNELQFFHVTSGLPADLAHDIFEGIVPEVLGGVLKQCVINGYFTMEYLNERIKLFPYNGSDRTNKPSQLKKSLHDLKIKETACQAWCLIRMFPLMVGHLVPHDSEAWAVLLQLLDVIEYCTAGVVTGEHATILADHIEGFLTAYYTVFPEVTMKPKFHYLVHYPELLLEFGPLVYVWTLRFEGKHNYFKEVSRLTKNRKNICKTLARRHEFMQASFRNKKDFLSQDMLHNTKGAMYPVRLLPHDIQGLILPLVGPSESVYKVERVQVSGTWYATGLAVIAGVVNGAHMYQFAKIDKCFIIAGEAYLLCQFSKECEYIYHVHAYSVQFGSHRSLLKPSDLHDYYPLPIYKADEMNLISIRNFVPTS